VPCLGARDRQLTKQLLVLQLGLFQLRLHFLELKHRLMRGRRAIILDIKSTIQSAATQYCSSQSLPYQSPPHFYDLPIGTATVAAQLELPIQTGKYGKSAHGHRGAIVLVRT
jgi:hypothetical protein